MLSNVLAAALAARLAGRRASAIAEAIRGFAGVPHRLETIAERDGVRWVNDSQATIPMAAIAALEAFDAARSCSSPAARQGPGLRRVRRCRSRARARAAILIGETADELEALIGDRVPVQRAAEHG